MPPRKRRFSPVSTTGAVAGGDLGYVNAAAEDPNPEKADEKPAEAANEPQTSDRSGEGEIEPQRRSPAPEKPSREKVADSEGGRRREAPPSAPEPPQSDPGDASGPSELLPPLPDFVQLAARNYSTLSPERIEQISRDINVELLQVTAAYRKMIERQDKFVRKVRAAREEGFPEGMLEDLARRHQWQLP